MTSRGIPDLAPEGISEYEELNSAFERNKPFQLTPVLSGRMFCRLVDYSIIVERWDNKNYGRVKRAWLRKFTKTQRNTIARYHAKFARWKFKTGTPQKIAVWLKTVQLLGRAVKFFATV